MTDGQLFSKESANEILPEVAERLKVLQEALPAIQQMQISASGNGGGAHADQWKESLGLFQANLDWFSEAGILIKDIAQGLVDFPSDQDGERIYLCWKAGEPSVAFWHTPDDGFAGRQPL
ncbi:MAG: DUF2203 domain-containing protein [Actinomycetota bacterium]